MGWTDLAHAQKWSKTTVIDIVAGNFWEIERNAPPHIQILVCLVRQVRNDDKGFTMGGGGSAVPGR